MCTRKRKGIVFVLSGPSGSGKTTLISRLLAKKRLKNPLLKIISCTTRLPRGREKQGRDYIFLSKREFRKRIKNREFLEWQKVLGEYYGTPRQAVKENILQGKNVLLCIDVKGAKSFKTLKGLRCVYIFILPAEKDWQYILKSRLKRRRSDSRVQIRKRLLLAKREIASAKDYKHLIFNKDIDQAVKKLTDIIVAETRRLK